MILAHVRWLAESTSNSFLLLISTVYFMQGLRIFGATATTYLFKSLNASPAQTQILKAVAKQPWNIKFLYGLASDNLPLWHSHTRIYILISSVFIFGGYCMMSSETVTELSLLTLALFLINFGSAFADVLIDASVVKYSHSGPDLSAKLQSWCWAVMSVGGMVGSLIGGYLVEVSLRLPFQLSITLPCILFLVAYRTQEDRSDFKFSWVFIRNQFQLLFQTLKSPQLLRPMLWVFLARALSPSIGDGMVFFRNSIGLDPKTLGVIDTVAYAGLFIGTIVYSKYLSQKSYRSIFFWTQVISCLLGLFDLILISRWNVTVLHIPDMFLVLTSDSINDVLYQLQQMPFLVMCAQLCPRNIEATLFATLVSLSNLASDLSSLFGAALLARFDVSQSDFRGLWWCVIFRSAFALIPCFYISMVPHHIQTTHGSINPDRHDHDSNEELVDVDNQNNVEMNIQGPAKSTEDRFEDNVVFIPPGNIRSDRSVLSFN